MTDTRALKSTNNESGTNSQLISTSEVATIHVTPVPDKAPGIIVMQPGTTYEEHIYYREKDAVLGTLSGLVRDIENQNGGVGREHQANSPWETLQSVRIVNNLVDIIQEGFQEEMNEVAYVSGTSFTVKTNRSAFYTLGRILRLDGAIAIVDADSTYSAGTGLTTVVVVGTVPNPLDKVEFDLQPKGQTDLVTLRRSSGSSINTGSATDEIVTPKDIADSNLAFLSDIPTVPSKGSGLGINTGTNDTDFITAKSIADSKLYDFIRGDGWKTISGTFTYASATTINVSSGAASIYQVGDKLRFQNNDSGTWLYVYIVGIADTLLTVKGNTVPNATLTDAYYSHEETPLGFPGYFLYIPTAIIGFTTTPADSCYMFSTRQRICYVQFGMSEGASGSNSVNTSFTLPIQCANNGHLPVQSHCAVFDNGGWILSTGHIYFEPNATVAIVCKAAVTGGDWTASGNKTAVGQFSYPI